MARNSRFSEKRKKQKRLKHIGAWSILLGVIIILILLVLVLRRPFLQMNTLDIRGNEIVSTHDIQETIHEFLDTRWLGLIPRSSIFIFPQRELTEKLSQVFPRFDDIDIQRIGIAKARVSIGEYLPAYLWCQESGIVDSCWYVGRDGYVFSEAPYFSDYVYIKFYGESDEEVPFRDFVFDEQDFQTILQLREALLDRMMIMYQVRAHEAGDYFLSLSQIGEQRMHPDTHIRFNVRNDLDRALRALDIITDQERFNQRLDNGDILEYIDVRFEGRALFKFRER